MFWALSRAKRFHYSTQTLLDFALVIMISGFLGARFFHIIYEHPQYYREHPLEVFKFWKGGFVFYGGALSVFLFSFLFAKIKKLPFLDWADFFAPIFALGYAIGRLGCFFNGCCYGKICSLPWAVKFPSHHKDYSSLIARHPTQLYAFFGELIILALLLWVEKQKKSKNHPRLSQWMTPSGQVFFLWVSLHSVNRIFMEIFRDDDRGGEILGLSISSLISLLFFFSASHFLFHNGRRFYLKNKKK